MEGVPVRTAEVVTIVEYVKSEKSECSFYGTLQEDTVRLEFMEKWRKVSGL